MGLEQKDSQRSCAIGCLGLLVLGFLMIMAFNVGADHADKDSASSPLIWVAAALVGLAVVGYTANKKRPHDLQVIQDRRQQLNQLTERYNGKVDEAKSSSEYRSVKKQYEKARTKLLNSWEEANKTGKPTVTGIWKALTATGVIATTLAGSYGTGAAIGMDDNTPVRLADNRSWSAENIPMPHIQDHSLYVSNPDSIISQEVEDSINTTLGQLDDVLGIESAMIIVGHIEDDDPIGMVRGVYDKYHVGRYDRGLVIVVGYLDHSYFIAPGRSLEGDLTDAECERLARRYLIPSMKAEQPDSGMLYLARGVLALMTEKDMPQMSELSSASDNKDNDALPLMLYPLLLAGWGGFCANMGRKVGTSIGMKHLKGDPFFVAASGGSGGGSSGGSWSGGGGGWSGGGHSSGGYGGGSWGGGGAGGRW